IRSAARSTATAATSRSPGSSSQCSKFSSLPKAVWSAPKSYWNGRGIRTQTRSPTPCASRSRHCANASANPGSSPPWPAPGTASTQDQTPSPREKRVDRAPGLSVRLKLTLSYAAFLMLAGAVLLTAGYFSLSRGVHPGVIFLVESHAALLRYFAPIAAIVMAFLLVFGLLGGWLLAGRMLAPLTRVTDATRIAATGSLSHRIQLEGRADQRSFTREHVDLSLIAEEAAETLLPLAEKRGLTIETSGDITPTVGSPALLLQMATNLVQNAIVHNLPEQGTVWVTTGVQPQSVVLAVENTGEKLTPQFVA